MPAAAPRRKQTPILWIAILVAVPLLFLCCGGVGVVALVVANRARETAVGDSILPSFTVERIDPDNLENTRAWAESTVKRLKEVESKGNDAATKEEMRKVEQKLKDSLLKKRVRWTFSVYGIEKLGRVRQS